MITTISTRWQRVTRRNPCQVCGKPDYCGFSADGTAAICMRTESPRRTANGGWLHRLDEPVTGQRRPAPEPRPTAPRAADADLDRVYRAVLARLSLAARHRDHLQARGLTEADLARAVYRSLPAGCRAGILRQLRETFADSLLLTVPGVIVRAGPHGHYMTLSGPPGIIVPIRSAVGHVVGLVVRPDDPGDGGKYRWLSSAPVGPSPGWRVHVPAGTEVRRRVVLTEGALKADVAAALAPGRTIVGLPGCQVTDEAIDVLRQLGAEEVLLALDADADRNIHVARAQVEGLQRLHAAGFAEGLIRWDRTLGKGLDDMLLALKGSAR